MEDDMVTGFKREFGAAVVGLRVWAGQVKGCEALDVRLEGYRPASGLGG